MESLSTVLHDISVAALPFLLAVTLHEAGHALAAAHFGDPTAKLEGRLSLNPFVHIDPFGTIIMPLMCLFIGAPFLIGAAKPVPVDTRYFKKPRRDMIITALAGPAGNLVVGIFFAYILRFSLNAGISLESWLCQTAIMGVFLNAVFLVFNLLPIPPLDGGRVAVLLLPPRFGQQLQMVEPYGFFILLGLIIFAFSVIITPAMFVAGLIMSLSGVPL